MLSDGLNICDSATVMLCVDFSTSDSMSSHPELYFGGIAISIFLISHGIVVHKNTDDLGWFFRYFSGF